MLDLLHLAFTIMVALQAKAHPLPASIANRAVPPFQNSTSTSAGNAKQLLISFQNNIGPANAYITGTDSANRLAFAQRDGNLYVPSVQGPTSSNVGIDITIPLASSSSNLTSRDTKTTDLTLNGYLSGARIWLAANGELELNTVPGADGPSLVEPSVANAEDPSAHTNWGFVEFTTDPEEGLTADISYVDFVGLPLGIKLESATGNVTQAALGVTANAVPSICTDLQNRAAIDGQPWDKLCVVDNSTGSIIRVIAPQDYMSQNSSAFQGYFEGYANEVWQKYATTPLTIDTQSASGTVNCTVANNQLSCDGDNRPYSQPSSGDVFGCASGPFTILDTDNDIHRAVVPRLCAAFNRATLLLEGGNFQPFANESGYYSTSPTNFYSAIVHQHEIDGVGYAFAYDDVTPNGGSGSAGLVMDSQPIKLTVIVGGIDQS